VVEGDRADSKPVTRSEKRVGHRDAQPAVSCSRYTGTSADSPTLAHDSSVANRSMNTERKEFLSVMRLPPVRLDVQETAWYLGFAAHDVPVLVAAGLIKPRGHPPPNGVKYFAAATLAQLRDDPQWLARASDAIVRHWQAKNAAKSKRRAGVSALSCAAVASAALQFKC